MLDDKIRLYIEFEKNITIVRGHHYYKSALNKNVIYDKKINELDIIIKKNKQEYERQCILLDKNQITNEYNKNKFDIENQLKEIQNTNNDNQLKTIKEIQNTNNDNNNKKVELSITSNQKSINDYFFKSK